MRFISFDHQSEIEILGERTDPYKNETVFVTAWCITAILSALICVINGLFIYLFMVCVCTVFSFIRTLVNVRFSMLIVFSIFFFINER